MPFEDGPYLNVAAICERALQEADGVVSMIRVIDKLTHTTTGQISAPEMPEFTTDLALVVMFKAGRGAGQGFTLTVRAQDPDGGHIAEEQLPLRFEDAPHASAHLIVRLALRIKRPGLYWVTVLLGEEQVTRVPLLVEHVLATQQAPSQV
jgi:hypothetical protein